MTKVAYRIKNWKDYNQALSTLGNIASWYLQFRKSNEKAMNCRIRQRELEILKIQYLYEFEGDEEKKIKQMVKKLIAIMEEAEKEWSNIKPTAHKEFKLSQQEPKNEL